MGFLRFLPIHASSLESDFSKDCDSCNAIYSLQSRGLLILYIKRINYQAKLDFRDCQGF